MFSGLNTSKESRLDWMISGLRNAETLIRLMRFYVTFFRPVHIRTYYHLYCLDMCRHTHLIFFCVAFFFAWGWVKFGGSGFS